jgi:hypothetical protein
MPLGIGHIAVLCVPEGISQMVAQAFKRNNGHLHHFAKLTNRFVKLTLRAAKRVSRLGVKHHNVAVFNNLFDMSDQHKVGCELSFTNAANLTKNPFFHGETEKSVDSNNVIGSVRENSARGYLKIIE